MYPLFGGYWGYQNAPALKIQKHMLAKQGRWKAEKIVNEGDEREQRRKRIIDGAE